MRIQIPLKLTWLKIPFQLLTFFLMKLMIKIAPFLKNFRLQTSMRGDRWITCSALSNQPVTPELQLAAGHCREGLHTIRFVSRAEIGHVTVWSSDYKRPTKKSSRHFVMTDIITGLRNFIEIKKLSVCCKCDKMWASGWALHGTVTSGSSSQYTVLRTE